MSKLIKNKYVLITGASSGIGEACALELARRDWYVFAGVRKKEDGDNLQKKSDKITPILLDVTKNEDIIEVEKYVRSIVGESGLFGLVNNAGIAIPGPFELLSDEDIMAQIQVNLLGVIKMIQTFLPLLRIAKGRIVIIGSNSGYWCEPFLSIYGATKFALEGLVDALRIELRPWNIKVSIIEPGCIKTPIYEKSREKIKEVQNKVPVEKQSLYKKAIDALQKSVDIAEKIAISPEYVAKAVCNALEKSRPKTRYRVGIDARIEGILIRFIPDTLRDLIIRKIMNL